MPDKDHDPDTDEESPLIGAQETHEDGDVLETSLEDHVGLEDSIVESKSVWYLILLTISVGGLQIVWSVEMSNGSPYLLSLGMSKALLAFVWLAGPLTGVLVQPYIGIVSDRCRISWGKRRPFMLAGMAGTVISSLLLSYAKEITWVLGPWSNEQKYEGAWKVVTIAFATVMMWCLDFAINTVQAAIRAFIVDGAPAHQQESANAWASRVTGVGNVLGYVFGYLDLPKHFHFFGNTQFKILCVIASIALGSTVLLSSATIQEKNPQDDPPTSNNGQSTGIIGFFKQVFTSIKRLSPQVRSVCEIQFFHWIGWFPFLFYTTTYIGQLYVDPRLEPGMTDDEIDELWARATRIGTLALLVYAIVSFASNIILPFLVVPTYQAPAIDQDHHVVRSFSSSSPVGTRNRSASYSEVAYEQASSTSPLNRTLPEDYYPRLPNLRKPSLAQRILKSVQIPGLTLRRTWMFSQILHAVCVFTTFFISTPTAGTIMVAFVGISWSVTLWAPFALISGDIARRDERRRLNQRHKLINGSGSGASDPYGSNHHHDNDDDDEEGEDRAGIILGLHNVAVSAPQVLATLMGSIVFKALQKDRGTPGDTSVAWTLRIGGVAALVAAWFTYRMKEAGQEQDEK